MSVKDQMYPHALTAWRRVPESRDVTWKPLGQMRCRWEGKHGAHSSTSGDVSATSVQIMLFSRATEAPLIKGDRVALGAHESAKPPADALAVTSSAAESCGCFRPDHWEVEAE